MPKLSLTDLANLQNEQTAVGAINANNDLIEAAMDNTLSRDGTSPNTMEADIDMDSNRIYNLSDPVEDHEPVTFGYANTIYGNALVYAEAASDSADAAADSAASADASADAAAASAVAADASADAAAVSVVEASAAVTAVAYKYTWNTATSGDPGAGGILVNNAAPGSATAFNISETDASGNAISAEIARWDDATNASGKSRIKIAKNATNFLLLTITSTVTDNGAYDTFTVSGASLTGTLSNGDTVFVSAALSGTDGSGAMGGTVGTTDNVVPRADGVGGVTLQAGTFTNEDGGNVIPNVNDTGALGKSGTAWADLFLASGGVINWNAGNYTITHSAGLLTTNGGLPLGTSNPFTCGTIELGAASDTTLARSAAGKVSIEGNLIAAIADPNADRVLIWDDSAGDYVGATLTPNLVINGTELRVLEVWGGALSDETTAITTGTNKLTFSIPYNFTVVGVYATLNTVSSSGTPTFDINEATTSILGTKIVIDVSEKTGGSSGYQGTAAGAATITDTSIAAFAEIGVDIDVAGTGAKGAKVFLIGYRT